MKHLNLNEQLTLMLPKALEKFEGEVRRMQRECPWEFNSGEMGWLEMKSAEEKFHYITGNSHWLELLTVFVLELYLDEMEHNEEFELNLN